MICVRRSWKFRAQLWPLIMDGCSKLLRSYRRARRLVLNPIHLTDIRQTSRPPSASLTHARLPSLNNHAGLGPCLASFHAIYIHLINYFFSEVASHNWYSRFGDSFQIESGSPHYMPWGTSFCHPCPPSTWAPFIVRRSPVRLLTWHLNHDLFSAFTRLLFAEPSFHTRFSPSSSALSSFTMSFLLLRF